MKKFMNIVIKVLLVCSFIFIGDISAMDAKLAGKRKAVSGDPQEQEQQGQKAKKGKKSGKDEKEEQAMDVGCDVCAKGDGDGEEPKDPRIKPCLRQYNKHLKTHHDQDHGLHCGHYALFHAFQHADSKTQAEADQRVKGKQARQKFNTVIGTSKEQGTWELLLLTYRLRREKDRAGFDYPMNVNAITSDEFEAAPTQQELFEGKTPPILAIQDEFAQAIVKKFEFAKEVAEELARLTRIVNISEEHPDDKDPNWQAIFGIFTSLNNPALAQEVRAFLANCPWNNITIIDSLNNIQSLMQGRAIREHMLGCIQRFQQHNIPQAVVLNPGNDGGDAESAGSMNHWVAWGIRREEGKCVDAFYDSIQRKSISNSLQEGFNRLVTLFSECNPRVLGAKRSMVPLLETALQFQRYALIQEGDEQHCKELAGYAKEFLVGQITPETLMAYVQFFFAEQDSKDCTLIEARRRENNAQACDALKQFISHKIAQLQDKKNAKIADFIMELLADEKEGERLMAQAQIFLSPQEKRDLAAIKKQQEAKDVGGLKDFMREQIRFLQQSEDKDVDVGSYAVEFLADEKDCQKLGEIAQRLAGNKAPKLLAAIEQHKQEQDVEALKEIIRKKINAKKKVQGVDLRTYVAAFLKDENNCDKLARYALIFVSELFKKNKKGIKGFIRTKIADMKKADKADKKHKKIVKMSEKDDEKPKKIDWLRYVTALLADEKDCDKLATYAQMLVNDDLKSIIKQKQEQNWLQILKDFIRQKIDQLQGFHDAKTLQAFIDLCIGTSPVINARLVANGWLKDVKELQARGKSRMDEPFAQAYGIARESGMSDKDFFAFARACGVNQGIINEWTQSKGKDGKDKANDVTPMDDGQGSGLQGDNDVPKDAPADCRTQ